MVERKNTTGSDQSKATIRFVYVLWQKLLRERFYMSKLLAYTTTKGEEIVERVKYIFELRKVDKEMRQRAAETKALQEYIAERKKELPEVWGE